MSKHKLCEGKDLIEATALKLGHKPGSVPEFMVPWASATPGTCPSETAPQRAALDGQNTSDMSAPLRANF